MTDEEAKALGDKALVAMVSALHLADIPMLDLHIPQGRTEDHKAEVARLEREYLAEQGEMDRYLDSRDTGNDDTGKELLLTTAPQEQRYTFAQPIGAPATGDDHDRN